MVNPNIVQPTLNKTICTGSNCLFWERSSFVSFFDVFFLFVIFWVMGSLNKSVFIFVGSSPGEGGTDGIYVGDGEYIGGDDDGIYDGVGDGVYDGDDVM